MKTNNTDWLKFIGAAVSALILCSIIFIYDKTADEAKYLGKNAINQISELNQELADSDLLKYDNNEVGGSDVVSCIRKYLGDYTASETAPIYIKVKTSLSDNTYTNAGYLDSIINFSHSRYIKPTAYFNSDLVKNTNKVIIGITFTQK